MATQYAFGQIINNGLVLSLDAADKNSYPGSGTVWRDLTANNYSGSLTNTPTFNSANGGSFAFNGTNQYISTTYVMPAQNTTTVFSWNCWVNPIRNNDRDIFMGNRNTIVNFIKLTSNNFEYRQDGNLIAFGGAMTLNIWQNICVVKNLTNFFYYKNGTEIATGIESAASLVANPFFIGGDNTATEFASGSVALARIYDRVLSADEIAQNYNAQKSRFGL